MSWAIGWCHEHKRDVGYGVPCVCEHPECDEVIHRGLSYACGDEHGVTENGCALYFCQTHMHYKTDFNKADGEEHLPQQCERCAKEKEPFTPKSDHVDWTTHKMTDPSWAPWRREQGYE